MYTYLYLFKAISTVFNGFWYQFTTEPRRSVFHLFCKSQYFVLIQSHSLGIYSEPLTLYLFRATYKCNATYIHTYIRTDLTDGSVCITHYAANACTYIHTYGWTDLTKVGYAPHIMPERHVHTYIHTNIRMDGPYFCSTWSNNRRCRDIHTCIRVYARIGYHTLLYPVA